MKQGIVAFVVILNPGDANGPVAVVKVLQQRPSAPAPLDLVAPSLHPAGTAPHVPQQPLGLGAPRAHTGWIVAPLHVAEEEAAPPPALQLQSVGSVAYHFLGKGARPA